MATFEFVGPIVYRMTFRCEGAAAATEAIRGEIGRSDVVAVEKGETSEDGFGSVKIHVRATDERSAIRRGERVLAGLGIRPVQIGEGPAPY
jgi:hypothetical protein